MREAFGKVPANETVSVKLFGYSKVTAREWKIGACTERNRKKWNCVYNQMGNIWASETWGFLYFFFFKRKNCTLNDSQMNVKKQFTLHTYIINKPRGMAQCALFKHQKSLWNIFASINHNPNKTEPLNLSPNEHVYEEDSSTCQATHNNLSQIVCNTWVSLLEEAEKAGYLRCSLSWVVV